MKSILDPSFRYTPAVATDVRKTFARVRKEQEQAAALAQKASDNVRPMARKVKA